MKHVLPWQALTALLPVLFVVSAARADEEIIVFGSDPLSAIDSHLGTPATVLDQTALADTDMRSIGETVANTPGVTAADFGPAVGRPIIRGLGGGRVRVLEDGIGTMDVSTVSNDHAVAVEPVLARQVEIFRGPATLLYGSGASGGFVNVVDDRIASELPEHPTGDLYSHYDSVSRGWLGAVDANVALGSQLVLHADALRRNTGDYHVPGLEDSIADPDSVAGRLDNSDVRTRQFGGGMSWVADAGFAGFVVSDMRNNYGIPAGHGDHDEDGVRIAQRQTRLDLKAAWQSPLPGLRSARLRWGFNDHTHLEMEAPGEVGTQLDNDEYEGRLEFIHQRWGVLDGVFGMQIQDRDFASLGEEAFVPTSRQKNLAAFIYEKADLGDWHLDGGLRIERSRASSFERQVARTVFSVSGSATYEVSPALQVGSALTRAERAPALEELFADGPHLASGSFEIGDIGLRRETSVNVELFIRGDVERWRYSFNVFYNDINNFIYLQENDLDANGHADKVFADYGETGLLSDTDDGLLLLSHAQRDARLWGVEGELEATVLEGAGGTLALRAWGDYVRAQFAGGGNLARISPPRIGMDASWSHGPWHASASLSRTMAQRRTATLESTTRGYTMLNSQVRYQWDSTGNTPALELFVKLNNLLNRDARRHTSLLKDSAPLPGRSLQAGLRLSF
ncbi:MAG: TonB-dependent receptor [Gammaproteobacteria bacterium]|nr:TonB-dependent receptor [Gammaproteobacteria bacterium]